MKSKKQHANHKSYMTKILRKANMKPSELASQYHKRQNNKDYSNYEKPLLSALSLLHKHTFNNLR